MHFLKTIASEKEDEVLVAEYRENGELSVLAVLYQRYMELLYGVCLKYLKDPEDSKDAVLAIYEELTGKLRKHEVVNFRGWLYQVAKNHCLMKLRSQKGKSRTEGIDIMQLGEIAHHNEDGHREEEFKILAECVEQLAIGQREVIELFYLQEKCYKEIATSTGKDINTIRSFIQNGRRNLKLCMEKKAKAG